jgi:hypothetical protein
MQRKKTARGCASPSLLVGWSRAFFCPLSSFFGVWSKNQKLSTCDGEVNSKKEEEFGVCCCRVFLFFLVDTTKLIRRWIDGSTRMAAAAAADMSLCPG